MRNKFTVLPAFGMLLLLSVYFTNTTAGIFSKPIAKSISKNDPPKTKKIVKRKHAKAGVYIDTAITSFFNRTKGWIASDGAQTVPLSDGSSLWLMGDSHINDFDPKTGTTPCLFQVRNCALLQPGNDWNWQHTKTLIGNGPGSKSYFKLNPSDEYFSWPGHGVQIKDTIYVFSSNLKKTGKGNFDWGSGGFDMWAKIKFPEMTVVGYSPLQDFAHISFGHAMIEDKKTGYIYVYGDRLKNISGQVYVARFPIANPNAKWDFWNGKAWDKDIANIAIIGEAPSNSLSLCKVNNTYMMFSSQFSVGCDQGKDIYVQTSKSLLGPFSKPKVIYSIPDRNQGHSPFFYCVFPHPEYINKKKELLVTYDINGYGTCVSGCVNGRADPNIYRPRGIRVPLSMLEEK